MADHFQFYSAVGWSLSHPRPCQYDVMDCQKHHRNAARGSTTASGSEAFIFRLVDALQSLSDGLPDPLRAAVAVFELFVDLVAKLFRHRYRDVFSIFHDNTKRLWRYKHIGTYSAWGYGNAVMYLRIAYTTIIKWDFFLYRSVG